MMKLFFAFNTRFIIKFKKKRKKINRPHTAEIVAQSSHDINIDVLMKFHENRKGDTQRYCLKD